MNGQQVNDAASRPASWHALPNKLTDEVMPRLKDTELRVLLVVLRQTWGWRAAPGETPRKRRDWLSHRQLCRRTGRGSEAVSGAVASLVATGLLAVEDAAGAPLATPEQRRRCLGRLYFRPGDGFGQRVPQPPAESLKHPAENLARPWKTCVWKSGEECGKAPGPLRPVKPKTTKDTINKRHFRQNSR